MLDRKLAVILFVDISGYSALMQEKESEALKKVKQFKSTIENEVPLFNGNIIHYYGDGYLVSFKSSTHGARCAIALQKQFIDELEIPARIGLHQGEVIVSDGNVYGDGVNIAARIESIGIPGSVLISKSIRDQIKNKEEFSIKELGSFDFKNISEPIGIYALNDGSLVLPTKKQLTDRAKQNRTTGNIINIKSVSAVAINLIIIMCLGWYYINSRHLDEIPQYSEGNKYVLAIGIDNNPNWKRLYNANNDATGVVEVLQNYFGFKSLGVPLINENASKDDIYNAIENASNVLNEEDELIVFYAGHGHTINQNSRSHPEGYIVPYDAPGQESFETSGFIKIKDFLSKVSNLPARHITTIFDACYSGFAIQDQIFVSRGGKVNPLISSKKISRKVFSSAEFDQTASDTGPIAEHSLFTGFLIEGLRTGQADNNGDKTISMNELAIYLERNIYDYSESNQTPRFGTYISDEGGEMFLAFTNKESSSINSISNLIKNVEDQIYTIVPFRTSQSNDSYPELKTYLPDIVLDALSEYDKRKYKVIRPNLIQMSDSTLTNTQYHQFLKNTDATKYFSGRYEVFEDELIIKISLLNAEEHQIIYSFPDFTINLKNKNPIRNISMEIKKRIKGFMDNSKQVVDRLTLPPDYQAYKLLKRAYQADCSDREVIDKFINQALSIDSNYFRAHLFKAFSYVNCNPVNVGKAIQEWEKFKDIDFELSDYEEERFSLLEHELRGNYKELVIPKIEQFKQYRTRSIFRDAMEYIVLTKNISLAKELIKIAESQELDTDFRNDIFIYKNWMEHHLLPGESPIHFDRYAQEEEIIKKSFRFFFPSKILYDCQSDCIYHIEELLQKHDQDIWWRYAMAGDVSMFKNQDQVAMRFYQLAMSKLKKDENPDPLNELILNYKLRKYDKCIEIGKNQFDTMIINKKFSALRYYILSTLHHGEQIENENYMNNKIYNYDRFPGYGAYYLATIECKKGNFLKAMKLLKRALHNGVGFNTYRYNFDPDLKPMWNYPEFIALTNPK